MLGPGVARVGAHGGELPDSRRGHPESTPHPDRGNLICVYCLVGAALADPKESGNIRNAHERLLARVWQRRSRIHLAVELVHAGTPRKVRPVVSAVPWG